MGDCWYWAKKHIKISPCWDAVSFAKTVHKCWAGIESFILSHCRTLHRAQLPELTWPEYWYGWLSGSFKSFFFLASPILPRCQIGRIYVEVFWGFFRILLFFDISSDFGCSTIVQLSTMFQRECFAVSVISLMFIESKHFTHRLANFLFTFTYVIELNKKCIVSLILSIWHCQIKSLRDTEISKQRSCTRRIVSRVFTKKIYCTRLKIFFLQLLGSWGKKTCTSTQTQKPCSTAYFCKLITGLNRNGKNIRSWPRLCLFPVHFCTALPSPYLSRHFSWSTFDPGVRPCCHMRSSCIKGPLTHKCMKMRMGLYRCCPFPLNKLCPRGQKAQTEPHINC